MIRVQFQPAFNAQQTLYNNNMASSTTFEAQFPHGSRTINSRDMGRIIGVGGCGTKRLVAAVKQKFPSCRPFVRGDRDSGTFKISARGADGEKAVRFLGDALQKELDWVKGNSEHCPHPHRWVDASKWDVPMKHIIGRAGAGIKKIQEKGGFILHKERQGKDWFLVEGIDSSMVQRMVLKLQEHKEEVIAAQRDQRRPRRVQVVDLATAPSQAQTTVADTNSYGSLMDDSSEEDSSDQEDEQEAQDQQKAEEEIRRHLQSNQLRGRGSVRSVGTEMHETRCALAEQRGVEPHMVSDREVNEFLRKVAQEEDLEQARRQPKAQSVDTKSAEEFPDTLSKGDGEANVKLEVRSLGAWGAGAPQEKKISAKPSDPPMPAPQMARQNGLRAPPRPTLARTMSSAMPSGSAFDGTPPGEDCWPGNAALPRSAEFRGDWGDYSDEEDEF